MTNYFDNKIQELSIYNIKDGSSIFTDIEGKYIIPLYQRSFAWKDLQIQQLIDDIYDNENNIDYYLGSLIVAKKENNFEVIDGQQRLTTLFLLFLYLNLPYSNVLSFECRKKSDLTLKYLSNKNKDYEEVDEDLQNGFKVITDIFSSKNIDKSKFKEKLSKVKIYRIVVPENTDLNHYFEIMNTRGEQLEQTDILKAKLLNKIGDPQQKALLANIWDACSDMTGYVQMHFDKDIREKIFEESWNNRPKISTKLKKTIKNNEFITIEELLANFSKYKNYAPTEKEYNIIRYESIINFSYFLLHVLKIYIRKYKIYAKDTPVINELLDDKKLLDTFSHVINNGLIKGEKIDPQKFSTDFIDCLLTVRFLFDNYIIKREYSGNDVEGMWSLKSLNSSGFKSTRKPYYRNTTFRNSGEWKKTSEYRHKHILMLQSCLRVSFTSPKIMHWITNTLEYLYFNDISKYPGEFENQIEKIIAQKINEDYLQLENHYYLGVNTPHIVFNYLDYLLWKEDESKNNPKYKDFVFEFRNSVEHWYPQHPSQDTFEKWDDEELNSLGNLCIIQRSINSKFSNLSPLSKKETFKKMTENGSIKLRIMADITKKDQDWKNYGATEHGEKMISILENTIKCIINKN